MNFSSPQNLLAGLCSRGVAVSVELGKLVLRTEPYATLRRLEKQRQTIEDSYEDRNGKAYFNNLLKSSIPLKMPRGR